MECNASSYGFVIKEHDDGIDKETIKQIISGFDTSSEIPYTVSLPYRTAARIYNSGIPVSLLEISEDTKLKNVNIEFECLELTVQNAVGFFGLPAKLKEKN